MLSLKASSSVTDLVLHLSTVLQSIQVEAPLLMNLPLAAGPPGFLFSPALKLSFPSSNQVLRI
jgi:hypothetical protein